MYTSLLCLSLSSSLSLSLLLSLLLSLSSNTISSLFGLFFLRGGGVDPQELLLECTNSMSILFTALFNELKSYFLKLLLFREILLHPLLMIFTMNFTGFTVIVAINHYPF